MVTLGLALDLHDGGRSSRLGCSYHVSKVPNFTCLQLPCPHTVFSSVHWGHQWLLGVSFILGYLFSSWASADVGLSHALPCHSREGSFSCAGFEGPCPAILCLVYDSPLSSEAHPCPAQKPLWLLLFSESGRVIEDVCNRNASDSGKPGHAQVPGHALFLATLRFLDVLYSFPPQGALRTGLLPH